MKIFTQKIPILVALIAFLFGVASCAKKGASGKPGNVDYYNWTNAGNGRHARNETWRSNTGCSDA